MKDTDDDDLAPSNPKIDEVPFGPDPENSMHSRHRTHERIAIDKGISDASQRGNIAISLLLVPVLIRIGPDFFEFGTGFGRKP
jgi:hypothetical protein